MESDVKGADDKRLDKTYELGIQMGDLMHCRHKTKAIQAKMLENIEKATAQGVKFDPSFIAALFTKR